MAPLDQGRGTRGPVDEANAFLGRRGDLSLGLVPQALLDDAAGDRWALFWAACRRVDDHLDRGRQPPPADWRQAVDAASARPHLEAFLERIDEAWRNDLEAQLPEAWRATCARHAWKSPPALADYVHTNAASAGFVIEVLFHLIDPDLDAREAAAALGASVQAGDDLRDARADRDEGRHGITWEETQTHGIVASGPVTAPGLAAMVPGRQALVAHLLLRAMDALPPGPTDHAEARRLAPVVAWHQAIANGQVAPDAGPLTLPGLDPDQAADFLGLRRSVARGLGRLLSEPASVRAALRQDLRHRAATLDAWTSAAVEAALEDAMPQPAP